MLKYQLIANQIESHIYENNLPKGTKLGREKYWENLKAEDWKCKAKV